MSIPFQYLHDPATGAVATDCVLYIDEAGQALLVPQWHDHWSTYQAWLAEGNTPTEDPQWTTEGIRARKAAEIKTERDHRKALGVLVDSKWYHSDDASRIQQLGLVLMGANIPTNLQWKTKDGSFVTMTQALAAAIFTATATLDQTLFAIAEQKHADLLASADPANFDYSQGWPVSYQG